MHPLKYFDINISTKVFQVIFDIIISPKFYGTFCLDITIYFAIFDVNIPIQVLWQILLRYYHLFCYFLRKYSHPSIFFIC